ncbi:hypothetical protein [Bacteroides cellulosilyticus]|jgi:hypothetical protein|uniref:hypothetical protein n=1 Tax=Bacteroides cellulosilyticus TaxID=246787 RepID=UPI001D069CF8|nr:hypothetical protein [Bacteroides cellulosilyticus]MCB6590795.1 hypothetical protein [Bacteroides cellulosilyticus]DAT01142.1 MAG TPA: hypothetical protein [Caudoviricetes sp.]
MKTIQEVKNAKKKLEQDISSLISQFEKENEVSVSSLEMEAIGFCNGTGIDMKCIDVKVTVEL